MSDPIPAPPVTDLTDAGWDGVERRTDPTTPLAKAVEKAINSATNSTPVENYTRTALFKILDGVRFGIVILIVFLLFIVMDKVQSDNEDQQKFRDGITCFVIEVTSATERSDILTKCGFVNTPGNR